MPGKQYFVSLMLNNVICSAVEIVVILIEADVSWEARLSPSCVTNEDLAILAKIANLATP